MERRMVRGAAMLVLGLSSQAALAERLWDEPYSRRWAKVFWELSAMGAAAHARDGLAPLIQRSEVIFEGEMLAPGTTPSGRPIHASVWADTLYKGSLSRGPHRLTFEPSATSMGGGSRHLFFMRRSRHRGWTVLRACFLQPHPLDRIRLEGVLEGSSSVALHAIRLMVGEGPPSGAGSLPRTVGGSPPALARDLMREYRSGDFDRSYTAVILALALDLRVGGEVLRAVVKGPQPNLLLYQLAAHRLIVAEGDAGIRFVLTHIPRQPGVGRAPESTAFDLAVAHGKKSTLAVMKQVAEERPDLQASVAAATQALAHSFGH